MVNIMQAKAKKDLSQLEAELSKLESQPKPITFGGQLGQQRTIRAKQREIHKLRSQMASGGLYGYIKR